MAIGRLASLEPLGPSSYDFLYSIVTDFSTSWRWRYRGAIPSREQFVSQLWEAVLAQKLVVDKSTQQMAGVVSLYNYNPRGQNCYASALAHPNAAGKGVVLEGLLLLLDYGFAAWDLNKIYFEVLDFNVEQFSGLVEHTTEEARLRDHDYANGRYWDLVTYSMSLSQWQGVSQYVRQHPGHPFRTDP